ncbi:MerR family transcriptional regulator [Deinococcus budaensis]|uniref:DNA-binding transcriptional MerR regulator n=1 Tax=Deinococcus budaensis TaxID=1665626 RepID=A0A7W8LND4_9DEIO|nr:MerR family transcriptional regulator [Deinococcus budaensis]MBB5232596.1 DNA-binding transcriptional MerR regulator [Deinococcus budaensis]
MTPAPLPDATPMFTASEAEARTGVPAATLRQWERRYGVPAPARHANGYRLYSPHDLAQIGQMQAHVLAGVSASRAAQLVQAPGEALAEPPAPAPPSPLAAELVAALVASDLRQAGALLSEAHTRLTVEEVVLTMMAPALVEIGARWAQGQITMAHEHQASAFLRGRLAALLELAGLSAFGPTVLAACAPGEHHEIGLLMLALLLRRRGVRAEYLGANLPLAELAAYTRQRGPGGVDALLIALNGEWALGPTQAQLGALAGLGIPVFYGGALLNQRPELAAALGGHYAGADALHAAETIIARLHSGASPAHRPPSPRAPDSTDPSDPQTEDT